MPELNYIDKSFNRDSTAKCILSVQADQNGLAWFIFDIKLGSYVAFRKYRFDHVHLPGDLLRSIHGVLNRDEYLKLHYHEVRFLGYSQQSTLVPSVYFDQHAKDDYMAFNHSPGSEDELFSNYIKPLGIYNVFALPRDLVSLVSGHFKNAGFLQQATPFLWHLANQNRLLFKTRVYLGLNNGFFDVAATGNEKFSLYNSFQYVNETDLLYYVLYVYEQLKLNTDQIPLLISGELSTKLTFFETLKKYLPATRYDTVDEMQVLSPELMQMTARKYLNLLNLRNCELSEENIKAER